MYTINTDLDEELAQTFRYKTAQLLIKYLGFLLHDRKLSCKDWRFLVNKIEKQLKN